MTSEKAWYWLAAGGSGPGAEWRLSGWPIRMGARNRGPLDGDSGAGLDAGLSSVTAAEVVLGRNSDATGWTHVTLQRVQGKLACKRIRWRSGRSTWADAAGSGDGAGRPQMPEFR